MLCDVFGAPHLVHSAMLVKHAGRCFTTADLYAPAREALGAKGNQTKLVGGGPVDKRRYITLALGVLAIAAGAQEDPLTWFPLRVGSRWTYRNEWKSGNRNRPVIDRWTTEETVTGWARIP